MHDKSHPTQTHDVLMTIIGRNSVKLTPIPSEVSDSIPEIPISGIRAVLFDVYGTLVVSGSGEPVPTGDATQERDVIHHQHALSLWSGVEIDRETAAASARYFMDTIHAFHTESREKGISYPEIDIREVWSCVLRKLEQRNSFPGTRDTAVLLSHFSGLPSESTYIRSSIEELAVYYETLSNPVSRMPEAEETLQWLLNHNYVVGIVSNAQFYTPIVLHSVFGKSTEELGFKNNLCSWSWLTGSAKPGTKIFFPVLETLNKDYGIEPTNVLYVGNDVRNDVMSAAQLGIKTCLFAGDARSLRLRKDNPSCAGITPDMVVTSLFRITHGIEWGGIE
jgi:putative hydrolase of the HAD superfamily